MIKKSNIWNVANIILENINHSFILKARTELSFWCNNQDKHEKNKTKLLPVIVPKKKKLKVGKETYGSTVFAIVFFLNHLYIDFFKNLKNAFIQINFSL